MNYKKMYEELAEVVRGDSPNWTHQETMQEAAWQKDEATRIEDVGTVLAKDRV